MRIDTRIAERIKKIKPSPTLSLTSKAKQLKAQGKDVVDFSAGEPDFDTPSFIKEAAVQAINSGFTKYTPTTGIPELKKCILEKFKRDNNLNYEPGQIVVSCGAKHSIFNTMLALVNRGDEVIIPLPYWVSYPEMVSLCEARARFIHTRQENNFKLKPEDLKKHIGAKTKLLILNSPSNPTGAVYSEDELNEIAGVCVEKKIFVISDEIYEKLTFDSLRHISIASLGKEIYGLTITVNGLSKSYAMTGWRIGYLGAPLDIAEAVSKIQDHSTSNPNSIAQKAGLAALSMEGPFLKDMLAEFQRRRNYLIERLGQIKKLSFFKPQGAFYLFCDISRTGIDSLDFARRLLEEVDVALVPGEAFGRKDYVRISFATSLGQIEKGMNRIEEWLNKL